MEFYQYTSAFLNKQFNPHKLPPQERLDAYIREMHQQRRINEQIYTISRLMADVDWLKEKQPYYNVWPGIIKPFLRLKLDKVPITCVNPPHGDSTLLLRFPKDHGIIKTKSGEIRTMLVHFTHAYKIYMRGQEILFQRRENKMYRRLMILADFGMKVENTYEVLEYQMIDLDPEVKDLETALEGHTKHDEGTDRESELSLDDVRDILRLVCGCILLGSDDQFLERDILNKDRQRGKTATDSASVSRAIRRGKNGWDLGREIKVGPTIVPPHFGIRWTGPGRTVPKIVPIKGWVTHKDMAKTLPTGYENENS